MTKSIIDILTQRCIQDIMNAEDAAILEILGGEPPVSYIEMMLKSNDQRLYICFYIKEHHYFKNLRTAIQKICPEREEMLDKLLVLK